MTELVEILSLPPVVNDTNSPQVLSSIDDTLLDLIKKEPSTFIQLKVRYNKENPDYPISTSTAFGFCMSALSLGKIERFGVQQVRDIGYADGWFRLSVYRINQSTPKKSHHKKLDTSNEKKDKTDEKKPVTCRTCMNVETHKLGIFSYPNCKLDKNPEQIYDFPMFDDPNKKCDGYEQKKKVIKK